MKSLQYLNQTSSESISFVDARDADVIFDRFPEDRDFIYNVRFFRIYNAVDIIEIIQPQYTNIRYRINISGSVSLDFGNIPSGVTVTQNGSIYTVYGIDSLGDWNSMKNPLVTLDEDYFGDVSYEVKIIYNTETENNVEVVWNVGTFIPQAKLNVESTLDCGPIKNVNNSIIMPAIFDVRTELELIVLTTIFVNCNPIANFSGGSNITVNCTFNVSGTKFKPFTTKTDNGNDVGFDIDDEDSSLIYSNGFTSGGSKNNIDNEIHLWYTGSEGNSSGLIRYKLSGGSWIYPATTWMMSNASSVGASNNYFYIARKGIELELFPNTSIYDDGIPNLLQQHFYSNDTGSLIDINDSYLVVAGTTSADRTVSVYDPSYDDGNYGVNLITSYTSPNDITSLEILGTNIVVGTETNTIVWDIVTETVIQTITKGTGAALSSRRRLVSMSEELVAISDPDEDIGAGIYGKIWLYERETGDLWTTISNTSSSVTNFGRYIRLTSDYLKILTDNKTFTYE